MRSIICEKQGCVSVMRFKANTMWSKLRFAQESPFTEPLIHPFPLKDSLYELSPPVLSISCTDYTFSDISGFSSLRVYSPIQGLLGVTYFAQNASSER